jgi:hypothetical protein
MKIRVTWRVSSVGNYSHWLHAAWPVFSSREGQEFLSLLQYSLGTECRSYEGLELCLTSPTRLQPYRLHFTFKVSNHTAFNYKKYVSRLQSILDNVKVNDKVNEDDSLLGYGDVVSLK